MGANAEAGHGATYAIEANPVVAGSFTVVGELADQVNPPGWEVPMDEVTASQDDIDYHIPGRVGRNQGSFSVFYNTTDTQHGIASGLQAHFINRTKFGMRFRGPSGSDGSDERIGSGYVVSLNFTNPVGQGPRKMDVTVQWTGPEKVDGTIYGT